MSVRSFVAVMFLLATVGLVWHQRERLQAWAGSGTLPALPAPSLTERRPTADVADPKASTRFRAGELRKCVDGQRVSYSNVECPAGAAERAVTGAAVTVVPGTLVAKPAAASSGPSALHKALDITRDDGLREKIMERQIEGAR